MTIYLSKFMSLAIYPLTWIIVMLVLSLLLLIIRKQLASTVLLSLSLVLLWISAMPVTGQWLMSRLEAQYEVKPLADYPQVDAIVLLGGGVAGAAPPVRLLPDLLDAADRVWFAAQLYHAQKAPVIIASGGALTWHGVKQSEADSMRLLLEQLAVPTSAIVNEDKSLTTLENAQNCHVLLEAMQAKRILLVTSAAHLPRAMAVFHKQLPESAIIPAVTDVRVVQVGANALDWLPQAGGIAMLNEAWHEWVGLMVYYIKGWA